MQLSTSLIPSVSLNAAQNIMKCLQCFVHLLFTANVCVVGYMALVFKSMYGVPALHMMIHDVPKPYSFAVFTPWTCSTLPQTKGIHSPFD